MNVCNKILITIRKKFSGSHIHSIMKRKRISDEKLKEKYPEVMSDFYLDIYDKSIIIKV